ncbi:MAG: peptide MFS transporter [Parachlamydiales bacterium]|nr:peptide MFS transporter [Parachlamydiales bacterium]
MFGQPRSLLLLSSTEMWERFSFYGMRAILVLYMVGKLADGGLGWSRQESLILYGNYTMSVWLAPLVGGYLADRFLGQRLAIYIGCIIISTGHFLLAFQSLGFFYSGLTCLVVGTGFFKPCVTSILGGLYSENDPKRDAGYSIFYMGINIGAFFGGIMTGWLQMRYNFHVAFAAAGFAMFIAFGLFVFTKRYLGKVGLRPVKKVENEIPKEPLTPQEKKRVGMIFILAMITVLFFVAYEQGGGMLTIFTDQFTDRHFFGWEIPTSWLAGSLNPLFIVILAPVLSALWSKLAKNKKDISVVAKMAVGFAVTGLSFFLLIAPTRIVEADPSSKVSLAWLVTFYGLYTVGELLVVPLLWSMVSRIAPQRYLSVLMGVMLASAGLGCKLAGWVGSFIDAKGPSQIFSGIMITMFAFALLCMVVNKGLMRWASLKEADLVAQPKTN